MNNSLRLPGIYMLLCAGMNTLTGYRYIFDSVYVVCEMNKDLTEIIGRHAEKIPYQNVRFWERLYIH